MARARDIVVSDSSDLALLRSDLKPAAIATFGTAGRHAVNLGPAALVGYPNQGRVAIRPIQTDVQVVERRRSPTNGRWHSFLRAFFAATFTRYHPYP